jgi:NhaP-type Na+/H+ or K+/H+ antiporter
MNSLLGDTDMRDLLYERPPAARRLSERGAVALAEADRAAAAAAARHAAERPPTKQPEHPNFLEAVAPSGAIVVVALGLAFVFVITLVSLGTVPDEQKAAIVTAAFTVLGTIVGAYFGVRVGAAGKGAAEKARDDEAIKVQELTARVDPVTAISALDSAHRRIERS